MQVDFHNIGCEYSCVSKQSSLHSDLAKWYQVWGDCLIDEVFVTAMQAGIEQ